MAKILKNIGNAGIWTAETAVSELALPAAFLSTTHNGGYLSRAFGGLSTTLGVIKSGLEAYLTNDGAKDVLNELGIGVMKGLGSIAQNLYEDPARTLYGVLTTYLACKAIPYVSRTIRKR